MSDWQSEGHGFDSHTLHNHKTKKPVNIEFAGFCIYRGAGKGDSFINFAGFNSFLLHKHYESITRFFLGTKKTETDCPGFVVI